MIAFGEVDDGEFFVGALFRRKFGDPPPAHGRHFVAFARVPELGLQPIGYTHFTPLDGVMLGGGAITDDRVLRRVPADERARIAERGGVYFQLLGFAMRKLGPDCEAMFGYCGDPRAEAVDLRAGFAKTVHPHLLVNFPRPLPQARRDELIDRVAALGPF